MVAGTTDPRIIQAHKRLRMFRPEDYELVAAFIAKNGSLVLMPNILTEVSNLLSQIAAPFKFALRQTMRTMADECTEIPVASKAAVSAPEFLKLGLRRRCFMRAR